MDRRASQKEQVKPRFVLITPVIEDAVAFLPKLASACTSADVAAVILRLGPQDSDVIAAVEDSELIYRTRLLLPDARKNGAMLLLEGFPGLVSASGTDGAHMSNPADVQPARGPLKEKIVGAGGLISRHDAMLAGEAGADYVMFGEPDPDGKRPGIDALTERVSWWAELFQLPCIAYAVREHDIPALVHAGADFIALGEEVLWSANEEPLKLLNKLSIHLDVIETVS